MANKKTCLITGIGGQVGSYMAELLLSKGYDVHGIIRRTSNNNTYRIEHILDKITLHYGDINDSTNLVEIIENIKPNEIYGLAAQSFVKASFEIPIATAEVTGIGTLKILEAIRKTDPKIRFYQASSSEMFGSTPPPHNEESKFSSESPYAAAKIFSYYIVQTYRKSYNIFACNGISHNHTSPRRGIEFVTRKITDAAARCKVGLQNEIRLGNIDTYRDFGFAGDYVEAMWLMLQADKPDDYVISTGISHSIRDCLEVAFNYVGLDPYKYLIIDEHFMRPSDVPHLLGNSDKINKTLGWKPKTSFKQLIEMMVDHDLELAKKEIK
jgi:GDPmannose 4,6-dehydratase